MWCAVFREQYLALIAPCTPQCKEPPLQVNCREIIMDSGQRRGVSGERRGVSGGERRGVSGERRGDTVSASAGEECVDADEGDDDMPPLCEPSCTYDGGCASCAQFQPRRNGSWFVSDAILDNLFPALADQVRRRTGESGRH